MKKTLLITNCLILLLNNLHSQVNGKIVSPSFSSVSSAVSFSLDQPNSIFVLTNRSSYVLDIVSLSPGNLNSFTSELASNVSPGESIKILAKNINGIRAFRSIVYKSSDMELKTISGESQNSYSLRYNDNKKRGCELMKLQAQMGKELCQSINGSGDCYTLANEVLQRNNWCDNSSDQNLQNKNKPQNQAKQPEKNQIEREDIVSKTDQTSKAIDEAADEILDILKKDRDRKEKLEEERESREASKVYEQDPFKSETLWSEGKAYFDKRKYQDALHSFTQAYLYDKDAKHNLYYIALCYYKLGTYKVAAQMFVRHITLTEYIQTSEFYPQSYYYLAQSKYKLVTKYKLAEFNDYCNDWLTFLKYKKEKDLTVEADIDLSNICNGSRAEPSSYGKKEVNTDGPFSISGNQQPLTLDKNLYVYVDDSGNIKLYENGSTIQNFEFNTLTYKEDEVVLVFDMNKTKIWLSFEGLTTGKHYLAELPHNGPSVFVYFVGNGVSENVAPSAVLFDFVHGKNFHYDESNNGSDFKNASNQISYYIKNFTDVLLITKKAKNLVLYNRKK